jgi:hypothetical protein
MGLVGISLNSDWERYEYECVNEWMPQDQCSI